MGSSPNSKTIKVQKGSLGPRKRTRLGAFLRGAGKGSTKKPSGSENACIFFGVAKPPSSAPEKDCNFDTKLQSFSTKSACVGINPPLVDEITL